MTILTYDLNRKLEQFTWQYQDRQFSISFETFGQGKPILFLPSFSTVSSRSEMNKIAEYLASKYQVTLIDWLGFGDSQRPKIDYQAQVYQQLLEDFVNNYFQESIIMITSGHSAGYALQLAQKYPEKVAKIVLIAPTWKGPLKVMGVPNLIRKLLKQIVYTPVIGDFLYYLNTTPSFLRFMYRRHVYVNQELLTSEFINKKRQITQQKGAKFASVSFVTGHLDPFINSEQFSKIISSLSQPILNIIGDNSPPYSYSEMKNISQLNLDQIQTINLSGTLGMAEEFADLIAPIIDQFC